jgi:hypothetical protein
VAWGPNALVSFNDEAQKARIVARMHQLGWHYVDDPSSETAGMIEFSFDPTPLATTARSRLDRGMVRGIKAFFASFSIITALIGVILAAAAFYTDYRMRLLEEAGTQTTAQIERTYATSSRGGPIYYVSYRFVDGHGISHEGSEPLPLEDWKRLRPGDPISVTYLADDPERNDLTQRVRLIRGRSIKEMIWIGVPFIMAWISVPIIVAGFFFLGYWARRRHV